MLNFQTNNNLKQLEDEYDSYYKYKILCSEKELDSVKELLISEEEKLSQKKANF